MIRGTEIEFVPGKPYDLPKGMFAPNSLVTSVKGQKCVKCLKFRAKSAYKNNGFVCKGCRDDLITLRRRKRK